MKYFSLLFYFVILIFFHPFFYEYIQGLQDQSKITLSSYQTSFSKMIAAVYTMIVFKRPNVYFLGFDNHAVVTMLFFATFL